jgi:CHASE2 domain-containing sensor protein
MSRALLKQLRQPAPVSVAIAFAVFLAVSTLTATGLLQPVELVAYDTLLQLRPERAWTDERITVVRVTDEDIYSIGHWPMSDDTLARISH